MTDQQKIEILGTWISIVPEQRPSISKNADGSMKPFYLSRRFTYLEEDRFELEVTNHADAYGKIPLVKILIKGHMQWTGAHPIAAGAEKVDFIADQLYEVTPLLQAFCDAVNQLPAKGINKWEVNVPQDLTGKGFAPFGLTEGQTFAEYDLVYVLGGMMFWGARHVDGRGFDKPDNRPVNLQIPMKRE